MQYVPLIASIAQTVTLVEAFAKTNESPLSILSFSSSIPMPVTIFLSLPVPGERFPTHDALSRGEVSIPVPTVHLTEIAMLQYVMSSPFGLTLHDTRASCTFSDPGTQRAASPQSQPDEHR
jgi:hypothetical protein